MARIALTVLIAHNVGYCVDRHNCIIVYLHFFNHNIQNQALLTFGHWRDMTWAESFHLGEWRIWLSHFPIFCIAHTDESSHHPRVWGSVDGPYTVHRQSYKGSRGADSGLQYKKGSLQRNLVNKWYNIKANTNSQVYMITCNHHKWECKVRHSRQFDTSINPTLDFCKNCTS